MNESIETYEPVRSTDADERLFQAIEAIDKFCTENFANHEEILITALEGELSKHFLVDVALGAAAECDAYGQPIGSFQVMLRGIVIGRYLEWLSHQQAE